MVRRAGSVREYCGIDHVFLPLDTLLAATGNAARSSEFTRPAVSEPPRIVEAAEAVEEEAAALVAEFGWSRMQKVYSYYGLLVVLVIQPRRPDARRWRDRAEQSSNDSDL